MEQLPLIQFSKKYDQLKGISNKAFLVYVGFINLEKELCEQLYAQLLDDSLTVDGQRDELPYSEYIICLFRDFSNKDRHFVAFKPLTTENIDKYFKRAGQVFEVKINE